MERRTTIDPTKCYSSKDRERIAAMRWLPDLPPDSARNFKKPKPKKQDVTSHLIKRKMLPAIIEGYSLVRDKFPKNELLLADASKNTLRNNPNARFLSYLHAEALKTKAREEEELQKRQLETLDKYDWDLVKKIGQEQPFAKYIESLIQKGIALRSSTSSAESDDETGSVKSPSTNSNDFDEEIIQSKGDHMALENSEFDSDMIEELLELLAHSPFRIKEKGSPSRSKFFNDIDHISWRYGQPEELKETIEFQRASTDVKDLGESIINQEKFLVGDRRSFEISKSIAATIEQLRNKKEKIAQASTSERKVGAKQSNETMLDKEKRFTKFDEDRILLQRQLLKFLASRNKKKTECSLSLRRMVKMEQDALRTAENTKSMGRSLPTRNIWLNKSHSSNLLNVVEILPSKYK